MRRTPPVARAKPWQPARHKQAPQIFGSTIDVPTLAPSPVRRAAIVSLASLLSDRRTILHSEPR
jgi:hypothetical protein